MELWGPAVIPAVVGAFPVPSLYRAPFECPWTKSLQRPRGAMGDVPTASLRRPHLLTVSVSCSTEPLACSRRSWALLPLCFSLMLLLSGNSPPFPTPRQSFSSLANISLALQVRWWCFFLVCLLPSCPVISTRFCCTSVFSLPGVRCLHLTLSSLGLRSSLTLVSQAWYTRDNR